MSKQRPEAMKNRRDIGQVVFPIEKILAAREISSSCVGTEALLDADASLLRSGNRNKGGLGSVFSRLLGRGE